jgi:HD-like signal output (HDOD) protein/CheY-like chemotaxis protein
MKKILVVDDVAICREPIAASLRLAGYETFCAADGEDALRQTLAHHPDVILLDVSMPRLDGLAFLKLLRANPSIAGTRVILLTAVSEKKHVIAAASLGVKDYLLKSRFRLVDLLERIKKQEFSGARAEPTSPDKPADQTPAEPAIARPATEEGEIPRLLTRGQFLQRVERAFTAKTLSGVVTQVIALASSPRGDMAELATLIARDPLLSSRVLQTANSALFASGGAPITSLADAIRKIGFANVRNVAAGLGIFDCMPDASLDGFNPIRCWQHSFAVAQLCERLAMINRADESGLAYMVGLCHDLGDIFVRTQFIKEYQQVAEVAARLGQPKEELFEQMLGLPPSQMISTVLQRIKLPEAIRTPIEIFHSPVGSSTRNPVACILWMAENYANGIMLASHPSAEVAPVAPSCHQAVFAGEKPTQPNPEALRAEVLSLTVSLARLSRADEASLLIPLFKPRNARVWVACDSGIGGFDAVGVALASLADTVLRDRLPVDGEMDGIDGLVIVAPSTHAAGLSERDLEATLHKARSAGRSLPVLAFSSEEQRVKSPGDGVSWRKSISLSELAAFVEGMQRLDQQKAA